MIFPHLRISELERDVELKKERFENSTREFLDRSRETLQPLKLLKENKAAAIAGVLAMVGAGKIFGKVAKVALPKLGGSTIFSIFKAAWFWKLMNISFDLYKLTQKSSKRSRA